MIPVTLKTKKKRTKTSKENGASFSGMAMLRMSGFRICKIYEKKAALTASSKAKS